MILTVAGRELRERFSGRMMPVVTLLTALVVVALIVVPSLIGTQPVRLGLVGSQAQALAPALSQSAMAAGIDIRISPVATAADATGDVSSGRLDVAVHVTNGGGVTATVDQSLAPSMQGVIQGVVTRAHEVAVLEAAGVTPRTLSQAAAPVPVSVVTLHPQPPDYAGRYLAAVAAAVLLYVSLVMWGSMLATGVAQEKTSRTAEVLVAAIAPRDLLAGKVLGIGLCGLVQIGAAVAAGLIANAVVHSATIPSAVWGLLPLCLLWFILGYALYAMVYAAGGALVARQEEVGLVTTPFTMLLVGGYLLTFAAAAKPDAVWVQILALVPPLAPVLMPVRVALGHLSIWEMLVAIALMLVAIAGVTVMAARIYRAGILASVPRLSWRRALRRA